jgi:hypothetical protein
VYPALRAVEFKKVLRSSYSSAAPLDLCEAIISLMLLLSLLTRLVAEVLASPTFSNSFAAAFADEVSMAMGSFAKTSCAHVVPLIE